MSYERLLSYRPTNVVHRLGVSSTIPLLNGRHVLQGVGGMDCSLWIPRVGHPAAIPAIFRAAAHLRSLVGFCLVPESVDPQAMKKDYSPAEFLHSVVDAARALDQAPPFLVHVQEPPIENAQGPEFEAVLEHIAKSLEVGFTSFGIDLTACRAADCPAMATSLLGPVLELELSVVVRLGGPSISPDAPPGATPETRVADRAYRVATTVASLAKAGARPDLVVLPGPDELGVDAWQLAEETATLIAPIGIAWRDCAEADERAGGVVRARIGGQRLVRLAKGDQERVDVQKLEALTYLEATNVLEKHGGRWSIERLLKEIVP